MSSPQTLSGPVRDADWCEAEWAAGRPIYQQRVHLDKRIKAPPNAVMMECYLTTDQGGGIDLPPERYSKIYAMLEAHGIDESELVDWLREQLGLNED